MYFLVLNTLALKQKHRNFAGNTFKSTSLDENRFTFLDEYWFKFRWSFFFLRFISQTVSFGLGDGLAQNSRVIT